MLESKRNQKAKGKGQKAKVENDLGFGLETLDFA
jgi:hypothetical protein